jgi:hypothetical protein
VAQSARQLAMSIACGRVADQGPDAENARGRTMVQGCDRHVGPCIFWKSDVTDPVEKRPARCAGDGHSHDVAAFDGEGAGGGAGVGSAARAAGLRLVRGRRERLAIECTISAKVGDWLHPCNGSQSLS